MRTAILLLAFFGGCLAACTDAPSSKDEPPLCADLGCENAICTGPNTCICHGETCEIWPSCDSLGCSAADVTDCSKFGSCVCGDTRCAP